MMIIPRLWNDDGDFDDDNDGVYDDGCDDDNDGKDKDKLALGAGALWRLLRGSHGLLIA